jgi:hypothetical protein
MALHARMGSSNAKEAEVARDKLVKLLAEHGLNWNDIPAILAAVNNAANASHAAASSTGTGPDEPEVNVLVRLAGPTGMQAAPARASRIGQD